MKDDIRNDHQAFSAETADMAFCIEWFLLFVDGAEVEDTLVMPTWSMLSWTAYSWGSSHGLP